MSADAFLADRSERAKLRFSGPQRAWFLHQVLTQSFEDIAPGQARDAAMITPHGRMLGYVEAVATADAILCHAESSLRSSLPDAIRRYVFATQVEIDDVTDDFGLVLIGGDGWAEATRSLGDRYVVHPTRSLGAPAAYVWVDRASIRELVEWLERAGLGRAGEAELEAMRISSGAPRWGFEMNEKTLPQEAGIDEVAVHYDKGCYLGQEAMAKIHFRGKANRRLFRVRAEAPLRRGDDVMLDGTKVGVLTSASNGAGLALLRHTVAPGATVVVGETKATVQDQVAATGGEP